MDLAELIDEQCGAFLRSQAVESGVSRDRIRRKLRQGTWVRVIGQRVLAVAGAADSIATRDWAAYLAAGPGAVLAGPSAARRWGVEMPPATARHVWVIVPASRRVDLPDWISPLRWPLPAGGIDLCDGMLVTRRARSIVDSLRLLPRSDAEHVLDRACQRRQITLEHVAQATSLLSGRAGAAQLRRLVADASGGAESRAERHLHQLLRRGRIRGWVANHEVFDERGLIGRVDAAIPELKLALEADGRAYHGVTRFQTDRTRQNRLVAAGWTVLRFTWEDLVERPEEVLAIIRATISRLESSRG